MIPTGHCKCVQKASVCSKGKVCSLALFKSLELERSAGPIFICTHLIIHRARKKQQQRTIDYFSCVFVSKRKSICMSNAFSINRARAHKHNRATENWSVKIHAHTRMPMLNVNVNHRAFIYSFIHSFVFSVTLNSKLCVCVCVKWQIVQRESCLFTCTWVSERVSEWVSTFQRPLTSPLKMRAMLTTYAHNVKGGF